MSTTSGYWTTSDGQGVIYAVVGAGTALVLAVILGVVGYLCFRKGKFSKIPEMFAARPVWALPPRVGPPKPIKIDGAGGELPLGKPLQGPLVGGGGGVVIHHYDTEETPRKKKPPSSTVSSVSDGKVTDHRWPPHMTFPNYIPDAGTANAPFVRSFLPLSADANLTAPYDNVLTDNLLRFATGSAAQVPRNTNLKSVLILKKERRKNAIDPENGDDLDESEDEGEDMDAHNFTAIGGDEIEVDAKAGRIFVDENDEIHVYTTEQSQLAPDKEVI